MENIGGGLFQSNIIQVANSLSGFLFSTKSYQEVSNRIGRASHLIAVTSRYEYACVCRVSDLKPVFVRSFVFHEIIQEVSI